MHIVMLRGILRAPLTFFDTTPIGRIIGRFAKDVDVVDTTIPQQISDLVYCLFEVMLTIYDILPSPPNFWNISAVTVYFHKYVSMFFTDLFINT